MNTGPSEIVQDMIKMPLPNGGHTYYPFKFAEDALYNGRYSIFVTMGQTEEDASLLMATLPTGAQTILIGSFENLVDQLIAIPWEENRVRTLEGEMYRKIAPSLEDMTDLIAELKNAALDLK